MSWLLFLTWTGTGAGISGNAATVAPVHFSVERGLYRTPFPSSTMWSQYGLPSDYGMDERIVNDPAYAPMMVPAMLALPALSIVMRTEDMFGEANGLYTHADDAALQAACSVE